MGVPSALSFGATELFSNLPLFEMGFLDMMNIVFGNYSLIIGAFFVAVFIGYKWGIKSATEEIERLGNKFKFKSIWAFLIRFICPIAIVIIFGYIIITRSYF